MKGGEDGRKGMWRGGIKWGITELRTKVSSAATEQNHCLLLGEACLAAYSRARVQHCGMTLLLNFFNLCSRQIQRRSVCTGNRRGENGVDCIGKLVPVDVVVQFYVHTDM